MMTQTQLYPVEETHSVLDKLLSLKNELKNKHLTDFFAKEDDRFQKFSVNLDNVVFDLQF
jgi:glucose-6-phosphate isomerase